MNKLILTFFLSIFFSAILNCANAFSLNNSETLVFDHDEVKVNIANIACSHIGISLNELKSIVAEAVDQYWNKSPTSRLKLRVGNIVNVAATYGTDLMCNTSTDTGCDPNTALAVSSDVLITCNTNSTTFPNNSILAVTVPNNISGNNIIGSLMMINDLAGNSFAKHSHADQVAIIAHELGHTFGLGHSPVKDSLMYYSTVDMRTSLGSDDIDGISYLYPKQQPISCGSVDKNTTANLWPGLLLGFAIISLLNIFFKNRSFSSFSA